MTMNVLWNMYSAKVQLTSKNSNNNSNNLYYMTWVFHVVSGDLRGSVMFILTVDHKMMKITLNLSHWYLQPTEKLNKKNKIKVNVNITTILKFKVFGKK